MDALFSILTSVVSQNGNSELGVPYQLAQDPVIWPYLVAIGALATVVTTLWVAYIKSNRDHASELRELHGSYRKADEEKSKRHGEEHAKKDSALLDVSVKTADILARVEGAIRESTDALKGVQEDLREVLRGQAR